MKTLPKLESKTDDSSAVGTTTTSPKSFSTNDLTCNRPWKLLDYFPVYLFISRTGIVEPLLNGGIPEVELSDEEKELFKEKSKLLEKKYFREIARLEKELKSELLSVLRPSNRKKANYYFDTFYGNSHSDLSLFRRLMGFSSTPPTDDD